MTLAFNPAAIANTISGITISGVTVKDVDEIPQSAQMICPVLFPQPEAWLSDVAQGAKPINSETAEGCDFTYTLHYVFLLAPLGSGISQLDPYSVVISNVKTVLDAILNNATLNNSAGTTLGNIDGIGAVEDPSGVSYWGALLSFRVTEYA